MKYYYAIFLFICINSFVFSQTKTQINCAADLYNQSLYNKYPDRKQKAIKIDAQIYNQVKDIVSTTRGGTRGPVRVVPVVVHIIHNNGPENITNIQVLQGIQHLNDAFRNTGVMQDANGVDTEIEFCLAQRDPNGNATVGITRTVSPLTSMVMENDDAALKNIIRWNPNLYLNIWLVKDISSTVNGPGVSGYATLPSSHGQNDDGIVNEAFYFGSNPTNSKVHVHEAGHYLGLFHTFEAGCTNNNCLTDGDKVCDTPPDNSTANVICGATQNTCTTDDDDLSVNNPFRPVANGGIGDQNDMIENHMDYGDVLCHTIFTPGQTARMQAAVTGPRASLLTSIACTSPCPNPINISFTPSSTNVGIGGSVNFTNNTTGATGYNWSIGGNSFSTNTNSSNTFNTAGSFWVVLTATNGDTNCTKQDSVLITVQCNVNASFTSSATSVNPGGSVTFTSTSTGATTYQWYVDGIPQVTTSTFNYTFNNAGGYNVYLVACNAVCCDTSKFQLIAVGTCLSKEANMWYFGYNAAWDFNSGNPVPINNSAMRAEEAAASICDKNGNLLMYCNGQTLYDKNHAVMQNGNYLFGHNSSTMGALIVPQPGSATNYYVFTSDAQLGGTATFYAPFTQINFTPGAVSYHIVDITANAGAGAVITKNQTLTTNSTEKLVGIKHSNGTDIWIVTKEHGTANFHANLLTCTGLDTVPVISASGPAHAVIAGNTNSLGMMMISPDGKKIALAVRNMGTYLGDFNTTTGVVSNVVQINPPSMLAQGVAFSPDSKVLYTTATEFSGLFNGVYQYNISLGSAAAITASVVKLPTNNASVYCGMQLAPNGKIYIAELNGTALHVINNPNALGAACNLTVNTVPLNVGGTSRFTVPNFLVDYMSPKKAAPINGPTIICTNTTYYVNNNCGLNTDSLVWVMNGNSTILTAFDSAVTIQPGVSGFDTLISIQYSSCGVVTDTLVIQVTTGSLVTLGNDTAFCGSFNLTLDAGAGFNPYLWSTSATSQTINVSAPGTYWVEVTSGLCKSRDTIVVTQVASIPNVNLGPDQVLPCLGKTVVLNAGAGYQNYTWQDNSHNQTFTALNPGTYWVTVIDSCGNSSSDTVNVTLNPNQPTFTLGNDTIICNNQSIQLSAGAGYVYYMWSDSTTNQTLTVNATGSYWVQITDTSGCSYVDTIDITIAQGATIFLGNDTATCDYTAFNLSVANNFVSYLWSTNATTSSIAVTGPGTYWLEITDSTGCKSRDTIVISQSTNPIVNLGNDTVICNFTSMQLNAGNGFNAYLWNTTATTQVITASSAGSYWVQVTDSAGCIARDTILISSVTSKPNVNLGNTIFLCPGQPINLNAGAGYQSYLWQNNATTSSITVTASGTYWVTVQDSCGNISSDTILVRPDLSSPFSLGPDREICDDETDTLDAGGGFINYQWQDGSGNQTYAASGAGTFFVQVTSSNNCIYRDTIMITIKDCDTIPPNCKITGVPNAFSPNNDNANDEYCLPGWIDCIKTFNIVIYDRWGEMLYQSNNADFCWDGVYKGKILDAQVVVYYINALTKNNEIIYKTGNISIIR